MAIENLKKHLILAFVNFTKYSYKLKCESKIFKHPSLLLEPNLEI
jgi:hypothetical protein